MRGTKANVSVDLSLSYSKNTKIRKNYNKYYTGWKKNECSKIVCELLSYQK